MPRIVLLTILLWSLVLAGQSSNLCGNQHLPRGLDPAPIYKWWLDQDVRWIITPEERSAFKRLQNDEERNQFIERFWGRRDPTPDTVENEFKDEHYRRMMYANEHFGTSIPGWRTDRGRIYIMDGPPDGITYDKAKWTNDRGVTEEAPRETWHYAKLPSSQRPADLQFVDVALNGEYRCALSREEKDALLNVPVHDRSGIRTQQTPRVQVDFGLVKAPEARFKDLEAVVAHQIKFTLLPFTVTTSSFRVTDLTGWVPVKLQVNGRDLQWTREGETRKAKVRYYARVVSLTGRIVAQLEDEMDLVARAGEENRSYSFGKALPLPAALYRLDVAMQDVIADRIGTGSFEFHAGSARLSSVVLSETASDPVFQPAEQQATFSPGAPIHAFAQVYGLAVDPNTSLPDATIDYEVLAVSAKKPVPLTHFADSSRAFADRGEQISLTREFPAPPPGSYDLVLRVTDNIAQQEFCAETQFTVN